VAFLACNHKEYLCLAKMSWWRDPTSKHAFLISWVGVVLELSAAIVGLIYWSASGSALVLVFGLENIVDFLSSVVV
jgi:divalent metal cation (Fe/Co/Zn/Cd) transporter